MDDAEAFRRAATARPEDDLLRLVLADWYEDHEQVGYAEFIRAQVDLAPRKAWEPEFVRAKWFAPSHYSGSPFRSLLPEFHPRVAEWPAVGPFERGLPAKLIVRDLHSFLNIADEFCERYPLTSLFLPTASLPEWQRFAAAPWLPNIRRIGFYGLTTPIEALRTLTERGTAIGLRELTLERAGGPAVAEMLRELFRSPLGKQLESLDLRAGHDHDGEWIDAIEAANGEQKLTSLSVTTIDLSEAAGERLAAAGFVSKLQSLRYSLARIAPGTFEGLNAAGKLSQVRELGFRGTQSELMMLEGMFNFGNLQSLRLLDFSENPLNGWPSLDRAVFWATRLTSLMLSQTQLTDFTFDRLGAMPFWPDLVELDLRENELNGTYHRLSFETSPTGLVALVLPARLENTRIRNRLRDHYGDAVLFR